MNKNRNLQKANKTPENIIEKLVNIYLEEYYDFSMTAFYEKTENEYKISYSVLLNEFKKRGLKVLNQKINYLKIKDEDYISITDMLKSKDGDFFVSDWLRNRNTIEFLGIWEEIHNSNFNYGEFATIKSKAGLNSYKISVKEWTEKTNAIGIISKAGRYGKTFAHKDITFEFGMWISPKFKLLLIKEFERLKSEEQKQLGWNAKRELSKINYRIHTDAIKENLIPNELTKEQINYVYAEEADVLNMALFGMTAKEWKSTIKIWMVTSETMQQ